MRYEPRARTGRTKAPPVSHGTWDVGVGVGVGVARGPHLAAPPIAAQRDILPIVHNAAEK
jgi:hypothetical protein